VQRYFLPIAYNGQADIVINGDDYHHIARVMRMKPNDRIFVVFTNGHAGLAEIEKITNEEVIASVVQLEEEQKELPVDVTIAPGLPKGDKLEWIIQKGTELGAAKFLPFQAKRSIVKWDEKKGRKKVERWEKIAKEAAEQSHRTALPTISSPVLFKELLEISSSYDYKLIAYEESSRQGEDSKFAKVLKDIKLGQKLLLVFGPEGGLDNEEVQLLTERGFLPIGLGPRILRCETAPLYALSAISYHFELLR
jgi:16S rRNA (uracil1498-N3)-methyltransferase